MSTTDLPAGPELDAAVAKLMGLEGVQQGSMRYYSTDWSATRDVAEWLRRQGFLTLEIINTHNGGWSCGGWSREMEIVGRGATLPEAVCRAALKTQETRGGT